MARRTPRGNASTSCHGGTPPSPPSGRGGGWARRSSMETSEGALDVVTYIKVSRGNTPQSRLMQSTSNATSASYAHQLLGSVSYMGRHPRVVGARVVARLRLSVSYKALEHALGAWAPSTIGLEAKGREGEATTFYVGAILGNFLILLLRCDKATSVAHAASVGG